MSVSDLKYKNKYLKYKNKYLNLQRQIGGVDEFNPHIPLQHSLPDELVSSILRFSKSPPVNKETSQLMNVDVEIETSLKEKLGKITLDGLFSTGNRIDIREPLNNREIYLLAKLFVSNIQNTTSLDLYYVISGKLINFAPLKNALLNPTRPFFLSTDTISPEKLRFRNDSYFTITIGNDDLIDFQLRFIFVCIDIMKRQGDIRLYIDALHIREVSHSIVKFTNSFNTIILGLKINIPLKILNIPELILYHMQLTDTQIKALAEALKINTTLRELNLSKNFISDEGGKALAEALKINTTLTKLNLSKNSIGNQGASAIAEALKTNTTLTTLDFSWNYIDIKGAKKLVEAMKINTTLTTLYLKGNYEIPNIRSYLRDNGVVRNIKTD